MVDTLRKAYVVTINEKGVKKWDTNLKGLCEQIKEFDKTALTYRTIGEKMRGEGNNELEFTSRNGNNYLIQRLIKINSNNKKGVNNKN